jgi:hypothetical protein
MEKGDLVIVMENFPDWDWLEYTTGDIGIVVNGVKNEYTYWLVQVFFPRTNATRSVAVYHLKKLQDLQ